MKKVRSPVNVNHVTRAYIEEKYSEQEIIKQGRKSSDVNRYSLDGFIDLEAENGITIQEIYDNIKWIQDKYNISDEEIVNYKVTIDWKYCEPPYELKFIIPESLTEHELYELGIKELVKIEKEKVREKAKKLSKEQKEYEEYLRLKEKWENIRENTNAAN